MLGISMAFPHISGQDELSLVLCAQSESIKCQTICRHFSLLCHPDIVQAVMGICSLALFVEECNCVSMLVFGKCRLINSDTC